MPIEGGSEMTHCRACIGHHQLRSAERQDSLAQQSGSTIRNSLGSEVVTIMFLAGQAAKERSARDASRIEHHT